MRVECGEGDAINVIRNSDWVRWRTPLKNTSKVCFLVLWFPAMYGLLGGSVPDAKREDKIARWEHRAFLDAVLSSFKDANPKAVKVNANGDELIDQIILEAYLRDLLKIAIEAKYGEIPDHTVT